MLVLGVDPGVGGALALVELAGSKLVAARTMPSVDFGTKTRRGVDPREVGAWLAECGAWPDIAIIEHQQPMPSDGKSSASVLGCMFGSISSIIYGLGVPLHFTTPPSWKRKADLLGSPKEQVLVKARQVFGICPEFTPLRLVRDKADTIAMADAALIAWYGLPESKMGAREVVVRPPKPFSTAKKRQAAKAPAPNGTLL